MENNELQEAVRVLSDAMLDAKLHVAVLLGCGEKQYREIKRMFTNLFTSLPGIIFLAKEKQQIVGVMRMKSCPGFKPVAGPQDPPKDPEDETDIEWRKSVWQSEWARHEPEGQHWHLGPIGVLPSYQGTGIGSELMARFCREVDACGADAYLETDVDKNVRFYEKFGFSVIDDSEIFSVKNRYMFRPRNVKPE